MLRLGAAVENATDFSTRRIGSAGRSNGTDSQRSNGRANRGL